VAGCAGAADSAGALLDCSVFSFLLQPARISNAHNASALTVIFAQPVFLFMMSPFFEVVAPASRRLSRGHPARAVESKRTARAFTEPVILTLTG
jgi:hypothetical protein